MAEYIEREKLSFHLASEMENCGEANSSHRPIAYGTILGLKTALSYVNTLPTADVVEVVRCKDCKFYTLRNVSSRYKPTKPCCLRTAAIKVNETDFCSYGEKRSEGK